MMTGMLWLDDDKARSLDEKVKRAAAYYEEKYGLAAELCLVNKAMLAEARQVDQVEVRPVNNVILHHFWVGRAQDAAAKGSRAHI
ncbi:MAG: hypothetical protein KC418_23110 [Anaerolineales bacterium]|nr:hypothetical protein [Anaerolineales bacterium]MCB8950637.1 hypothetical protein [Ardenticatenales bacterium]